MFILNVFIFLCVLVYCTADCNTSVKNDHDNILLIKNGNILLPVDSIGTIEVPNNDIIQMACISNPVLPMDKVPIVDAKCIGGDIYEVDSKTYAAKQLTCKTTPPPTELQSGKCLKNLYENVNIGFQVGNTFINQINLCFDNTLKSTLYAEALLSKKLCCCQESIRYAIYDFYAPFVLTRGHLIAMCDFIYSVQQKMTFYLINAAPQWKSFNEGNWKYLEAKVKNLVATTRSDYQVFTGTYGILQLNNTSGGKSKIYLNYNPRQGVYQMPVPLYFWKVLINMDTKKGLAIIGMNNIHEKEIDPCTNIIANITWLQGGKWNSIRSGYTIACEINEFKNIPGLRDQLPLIPPTTGTL
ncbi:uncharacterized protein CBL_00400 [Carabus blaptoides fortunei]